ncbi:MAG: hypothetical protein NTZ01_07330, partial [Verrucomicrobia bacterium]|nr:hypothetical protein [Verrucomicrobiota bacterium]
MKKLSIVLGLVLWSLFAAVALPLQPPLLGTPTLTVPAKDHPLTHFPTSWVTWNLQWFPGQTPRAKEPAREKHEKAVQETLQNINPQVAILEEVMDEGALGRVISDHPWRAVSNFQRAKDEDEKLPPQNVAIASQIPWREVWEVDFHALPLTPDRPVRGFLGAEFSDRGGRSLTVYAVHLKSNRGGREASGERRERAVDYLRWDWH